MKISALQGYVKTKRYYTSIITCQQLIQLLEPSVLQTENDLPSSYSPEPAKTPIVLTLTSGEPDWIGVEFQKEYTSYHNIGFLDFDSDTKFTPVFHQQEIRAWIHAFLTDPEKNNLQLPVIFIKQKTQKRGTK